MAYYGCGLCQREDCYGCPNYNEYESPADYYRNEGYDKGYEEGYKKGYEKGKSERHGLICIFAKPEGTFCKFLNLPCDGCDLSCKYLCVHDEMNFLDKIDELEG
ncbi:hypothetical protein [Otoolea muris]|uniref:hypothetical protein n=1 Tax=Otoolea muris TaxID=2941515 RepID=UPI00204181E7|nr:hypothetical protein [Otoolea muris]